MNNIPQVHCPSCSKHMKLKHIAPDAWQKSVMHFTCDCGFAYSMSARAKSEYGTGYTAFSFPSWNTQRRQ